MDGDDEDEESDEEENGEEAGGLHPPAPGAGSGVGAVQTITDMTETDMVNLRRTIYLTIMSSMVRSTLLSQYGRQALSLLRHAPPKTGIAVNGSSHTRTAVSVLTMDSWPRSYALTPPY
jgi:hypothetical protein